jgi:hypothetical protein
MMMLILRTLPGACLPKDQEKIKHRKKACRPNLFGISLEALLKLNRLSFAVGPTK